MLRLTTFVHAALPALLTLSFAASAHAETTGITTDGSTGEEQGAWIEITNPQHQAEVTSPLTVEVTGYDTSQDTLASIRLIVDGQEVAESCDGAGVCMFEVELEPGEHTLEAYGTSQLAEPFDLISVTVVSGAETDGGDTDGSDTDGSATDGSDTDGGPVGESDTDAGQTSGNDSAGQATDGSGSTPENDADLDDKGCGCTASGRGSLASMLGLFALAFIRRRR